MGAPKKQKPHSRSASVGKIIRGWMVRADINSQTELGNFLGLSKATISKRFCGNPFWDLSELWMMDKALRFTDEEWLKLRDCARR